MPTPLVTRYHSAEQRFWSRVEKTETCWNWTGFVNKWNYGRFRGFGAKKTLVHRFSWMIHFGPIAKSALVLHSCDNPRCVRPDHLFLGTFATNNDDRDRKWRLSHKLSEKQIEQIRAFEGALSCGQLARIFQVSPSNIRCVQRWRTWKWVGASSTNPPRDGSSVAVENFDL